MRSSFDGDAYLLAYPDVAEAEIDPITHYLESGWREGRVAASWFDPKAYAKSVGGLDHRKDNVFVHLLLSAEECGEDTQDFYWRITRGLTAADVKHRKTDLLQNNSKGEFLHRDGLTNLDRQVPGGAFAGETMSILVEPPSREQKNLVAKSFDWAYYLSVNPDVADSGVDPLTHFMAIGWLEGRDPSPDFCTSYYLRNNPDIRKDGLNPFVHYLTVRNKEKWRRSASVEGARVLDLFESDGRLKSSLDEAIELDPMVGFPRGVRKVTSPVTSVRELTDRIEELRAEIGALHYEYVVLVPHIRMSGAARVGAIFTSILGKIVDPSRILVLITDSSEVPYEHWFPSEVRRFDLTEKLDGLSQAHRINVLMDLLRGVHCNSIVNINSRLAWEALREFGRQMSQDFQVVTYFFTWDETEKGLRGGYPIQWLRDTSNVHDILLTDTEALARYIRTTKGYYDNQVIALYTPVGESETKAVPAGRRDKPRFLWAGRFDRQKRLDILVAIARANPQICFDVFGKAVLDSRDLESYDPPSNINAKGTYTDLSEVLQTRYHGFLYTAQWDGIPTILLDIGSAELPIVAPRVGGIDEVIDASTGWLIDDFTDIEAYSKAMGEMVALPEEAQSRAKKLKSRLREQFAEQLYCSKLMEALNIAED